MNQRGVFQLMLNRFEITPLTVMRVWRRGKLLSQYNGITETFWLTYTRFRVIKNNTAINNKCRDNLQQVRVPLLQQPNKYN